MTKQNQPNENAVQEIVDGQLESIVGGASQTIGFAPILPPITATVTRDGISQTIGITPNLPPITATVTKN